MESPTQSDSIIDIQQHNPADSFLLNYEPSEIRTASEFFTTWLPFLSRDLCSHCTQILADRIRSICPESNGDATGNKKLEEETSDSVEAYGMSESESQLVSGTRPKSWADLTEEDEFRDEENKTDDSSPSVTVVTHVKPKLSRDPREHIRFMNIRRNKDFVCFERVRGKLVNILQGLELHEGIFSAAEQARIVNYVTSLQEMGKNGELQDRTFSAPHKWMRGKGRQTIQFGCCYNYAVDREGNPPGILAEARVDPLPDLFKVMIRRLMRWHVLPPTCVPDSCIVNIYDEGDCIPPHIDNHDFVRPFCTVSFLSECNILFGSNLKIAGPGEFDGSFAIPLPVGSVLVLNGNGADVAKHCVPAVPSKRISITFRKMDVSKRPRGYVAEPDLQGIEPLACEVEGKKRSEEPNANGYAYAKRQRQGQGQGQRRQSGRDKNYRNWEHHISVCLAHQRLGR